VKRYEFSITSQNKIKATDWQNGDWVKAEEALKSIAELTSERDEARDLCRQVADMLVAECLIGVGQTVKDCREAVKRWEGEK
jgi:hypothetical protein